MPLTQIDKDCLLKASTNLIMKIKQKIIIYVIIMTTDPVCQQKTSLNSENSTQRA